MRGDAGSWRPTRGRGRCCGCWSRIPEVRYVLPDRVGLEAGTDARLIETLMRFLGRQEWLITRVTSSPAMRRSP